MRRKPPKSPKSAKLVKKESKKSAQKVLPEDARPRRVGRGGFADRSVREECPHPCGPDARVRDECLSVGVRLSARRGLVRAYKMSCLVSPGSSSTGAMHCPALCVASGCIHSRRRGSECHPQRISAHERRPDCGRFCETWPICRRPLAAASRARLFRPGFGRPGRQRSQRLVRG